MELLLFSAALIGGIGALRFGEARSSWVVAACCVMLAAAAAAVYAPRGDAVLEAALPGAVAEGGFATSASCRACHPAEYHSWHRSFHRTMTQVATPKAVLGSFDGVVLEDRGFSWRFERRGDEFWVDMPDPLWFSDSTAEKTAAPPRIEVRVVMTTGSHHQQTYWVRRPVAGEVYRESSDNGALVQVPWVWLVDERRWIASQDSFLAPPSREFEASQVWNTSCFACHSVATQPHFDDDEVTFATRSVELGIACEACHGPAEEHTRANTSPLRRYWKHFAGEDEADPTIVNAARLDKQRSVEVCGQCHSFSRPQDMEEWKQTGTAFRAGDELGSTLGVVRWEREPRDPVLLAQLAEEASALEGAFWSDGTIRVTGREYNGLLESACFQRGEMTCLSCHSMHRYEDPSDQLARDGGGDESCLHCHGALRDRVAEHTHHAPGSEGSGCMNCHMPHTTYGLFSGVRSHRIDSPSAARSAETGRPNACNLCHLDRTFEWTSRHLSEWYGQPPVELEARQRSVAAAVLWAVEGDAAERAISAWHMGWEPAQRASGRAWLGIYLAALLGDPYAAVRRVARNSLETLPGFADFEFDFAAPADVRHRQQGEAISRWRRLVAGKPDRSGPQLLLDASGELDVDEFNRILAGRDTRPLRITE